MKKDYKEMKYFKEYQYKSHILETYYVYFVFSRTTLSKGIRTYKYFIQYWHPRVQTIFTIVESATYKAKIVIHLKN